MFLALALAYLGRKAGGDPRGRAGVALTPIASDGYTGPYLQHVLARIYLLAGEPEKAIDRLEPLLASRTSSPGLAPDRSDLRSAARNPRFRKLVEGGA